MTRRRLILTGLSALLTLGSSGCGDRTVASAARGSAQRGLALMEHTPDSLPRYARSALRCTSCHLDQGRRANAAPVTASFAHYPRYVERAGAIATIQDRVNYCFTRSLAGRALPANGGDMRDIVAYLELLSRGIARGGHVAGEGLPKMAQLAGDSARGRRSYAATCARCHAAAGEGTAVAPALWGPRSFSIGASMARRERAASFIRHNMPLDRPGTLSDQEAWDLAAFVTTKPRPDLAGKERDWPNGDAPADVPYATAGHAGYLAPPSLGGRESSSH